MSGNQLMKANVGFQRGPRGRIEVEASSMPAGNHPLLDPRAVPPSHAAAGGREPSPSFVEKLTAHDSDMSVFWNRYIERWVIWRKPPYMEETLVFVVEHPDTGVFWPLDNRTFAFLYDSDPASYGGLKQMWAQIQANEELKETRRGKRWKERARCAWEASRGHAKIRVGYGYSPGNKAVMHAQGGDNVPVPNLSD